jgi:hypothetical protein
LADVELSADRADRRNAIRCQMIGEYLGCLLLKRVRNACATGRAVRYRLRNADDYHEQFVGADQLRRPCCADRLVL